MSEPTFSFIFVNFQSVRLLEKSLVSLRTPLQGISHEILVANNDIDEKNALAELQKTFPFELIEMEGNVGFGKANNAAAKKARGHTLFFLNPDTEFFSGSFRALEELLRRNEKALYGFRLLTPLQKLEPWTSGKRPTILTLIATKLRSSDSGKEKKFLAVDWVSGAAFAITRTSYEALEGFDEDFFLYYEDVDLSLRAKEKGIQPYATSLLSFTHARGQSHTNYQTMKDAYFAGQRMYFKKHGNKIENFLLSFLQPLYRLFRF